MKFRSVTLWLFLSAPLVGQQGVTAPVSPATTPPVTGSGAPLPGSAAPAAVPEAPPPPSAPAANSIDYLIGPEDAINVTVWKEPNLSGPLTVRPDGMISLPLVGDVRAAGLTPMLLGTDLSTRFKKYINAPLVTVTVTAVNSKHIFLLGEVQHIGSLPLAPGMTLLQAISAAGGLTPYANAKRIYVLRGEAGKRQKIPFNYKKAIKEGDEQGVSLSPGDTIVVP